MSDNHSLEEYSPDVSSEQSGEQCQGGALCPASTSRGISHSSGDYDEVYSSCTDSCSCDTVSTISSVNVVQKPCHIADSTSRLRKSKWRTIKKYFTTRLRLPMKHKRPREAPIINEPEVQNEVVVQESSKSASTAETV